MPRRFLPSILGIVLAAAAGCRGPQLVGTPNLYADAGPEPFAQVPPELQTNTVDILYATDRLPKGPSPAPTVPGRERDEEPLRYGYGRSPDLAFGSCVVEIGDDVPWETLVEASTSSRRAVPLPVRVRSIDELGRFPETPAPLEDVDGVTRVPAGYVAETDEAVAAFQREVSRRLALTPRKEALVYVHGFNNTFEAGAYRMTDLWHFLGREGVPIMYSWPAGFPGLLKGYTHDRESGEFTLFHLKQFLVALAGCPDLERINLVAHSRGTGILTNAVRELVLVTRARGDDLATLKFGDLVLAAPDISGEVASQRIAAENLQHAVDSATFYVMKNDHAIGSAELLFADPKRLGQIRPEQLTDRARERLAALREIAIVDSRIHTDWLGHGYFLSSPATFSDLILHLRYRRPVGAEHGRPLTLAGPKYYILDDEYPQKAAPMPKPKGSRRP
jgi:esterase/lipase superfamily enzyme